MSDPTVPPTVAETVPTPATPAPEATPPVEQSDDDILRAAGLLPPLEAPAAEEKPAEATETPAAEPEVEPVGDTPVVPEAPVEEPAAPAQPAAPAREPADVAAQQQAHDAAAAYQQRVLKFNADLEAHNARVNSEDYDPYTDGKESARLNIERARLDAIERDYLHQQTAQLQAAQQRQNYWHEFEKANPLIPAKQAEAKFQEFAAAALSKYPDPKVAQAVATEKWEDWKKVVAGQRAAKAAVAPKPAKPGPTVTPGGATVTPPAAGAVRPPAPEVDPEEEFVALYSKGIRQFARG